MNALRWPVSYRSWWVLLGTLLIALVSAAWWLSSEPRAEPSPQEIVRAATRTYIASARRQHPGEVIPRRYWAPAIRSLRPVKVYTHRLNVVVVQKIKDGKEQGLYVKNVISSYLAMDGDDGFQFTPNPRTNGHYISRDVTRYERQIE